MRRAISAGCLAAMGVWLAAAVLMAYETVTAPQEPTPEPVIVEQAPSPTAETADGTQSVRLSTADGVETLALDDYLTGVVMGEMPASFPQAALEAQAVAARTFTCKQMLGGKHDGADVCADSGCCQAYLSPETAAERMGTEYDAVYNKVRTAVEATDGQVLTYDDALIDAVYFSCSGGVTEDAVAVWGNEVPYLQSVESPGEEDAPPYEDVVSVERDVFRQTVEAAGAVLPEDGGQWFGKAVRSSGGGVETVEIGGVSFTGTEVRSLFNLRSTRFSVTVGEETVDFYTRGYGHRVGLSQYGAAAMADGGSTWQKILQHYYTGVDIVDMETVLP